MEGGLNGDRSLSLVAFVRHMRETWDDPLPASQLTPALDHEFSTFQEQLT
jgi:hypothetical protein